MIVEKSASRSLHCGPLPLCAQPPARASAASAQRPLAICSRAKRPARSGPHLPPRPAVPFSGTCGLDITHRKLLGVHFHASLSPIPPPGLTPRPLIP